MAVYRQHPRYSILLGLILLGTLWTLLPDTQEPPSIEIFHVADNVRGRVERANRIYDRFLEDRAGLIKKFGPEPKDIMMYAAGPNFN